MNSILLVLGFLFISITSSEGRCGVHDKGLVSEALIKTDFSKVVGRVEQRIGSSSVPRSELSMWIGWVDPLNDRTVFELSADKPMIPASVSKLITAATALKHYNPNHQFKTELSLDGEVSENVLNGNLYLKGGGDPSLTSEQMWNLVNEFQREGIKKIEGHVFVDDSRFDRVRFDPSREQDRVDRPYDSPVGGMSFNWNTANIFVRPGEVGERPRVIVDPDNRYVRIENRARTVSGDSKKISVERLGVFYNFNGEPEDVMRVTGTIGVGTKEVAAFRNISQPDFWSGYALISFLKQRGIEVAGKVKLGEAPRSAKLVATLSSRPMNAMVSDLMKFSNNFVAEMLTKNLAADFVSTPAKMSDGIDLIHKFMNSIGIASDRFTFVNPSGLTRVNKFRASDIGKVLRHLRSSYQNFPELLASKPIGGIDGTLRRRMGGAAKGWVRAKTGTLTGVAGLAGYAFRPSDGKAFEFAFFWNGSSGRLAAARKLFDRVAEVLVTVPVSSEKLPQSNSVSPFL